MLAPSQAQVCKLSYKTESIPISQPALQISDPRNYEDSNMLVIKFIDLSLSIKSKTLKKPGTK